MKDQMISKGLPQVSDSRICIHISKAKCEKKKKKPKANVTVCLLSNCCHGFSTSIHLNWDMSIISMLLFRAK